ncbi:MULTISPECIES: hypothetical protein [unclassified Nocardiopsis]|uniref:hypothetical protein n=1 Tax=Nocardiopsis TaxID=2013 RepID=UPI00387B2B90
MGTLWEIGDGFAAAAAADFYREPGAVTLHNVVRRMRHGLPDRAAAWASLVHAGA